jgi:hypothetical protein
MSKPRPRELILIKVTGQQASHVQLVAADLQARYAPDASCSRVIPSEQQGGYHAFVSIYRLKEVKF